MPYSGDNMMGVKRANRSAALRLLHEQGATSRKRLAERLRLTPAAITKIAAELLAEGLVREGSALPGAGAGRREIALELNPRAGCALGVLINLRVAVLSGVWLDGGGIFSESVPLPPKAEPEETAQKLSARLLALAEENGLARESIVGLGIAVRGITSPDGLTLANSFGALGERNFPLCRRFEELTGLPAVMENNVRALFAAQTFLSRDAAQGSQFFLRCEYGIGASLSIDGKIWHGVTEQCAEIGHIPVIRRGGKPCVCGKSGCLETISSPMAIREDALALFSPERTPVLWNMCRGKGREEITLEDVLTAASCGDEGAASVTDRAVASLGAALKALIYLVDPGKIVLYGHIFDHAYFLSKLLSEMSEGVDAGHAVQIEKSRYNLRLDDKAAGILAVEHFLDHGGNR